MKLEVLIPFKIRANGEEITLYPGQRIRVREEIAVKLLGEGRVRQVDEGRKEKERFPPIKIYSQILDDTLWLVYNKEEMKKLRTQEVEEAIYTAEEILIMEGMTSEQIRKVHLVKKSFPNSLIEAYKQEGKKGEVLPEI